MGGLTDTEVIESAPSFRRNRQRCRAMIEIDNGVGVRRLEPPLLLGKMTPTEYIFFMKHLAISFACIDGTPSYALPDRLSFRLMSSGKTVLSKWIS